MTTKRPRERKWTAEVTQNSDAMDVERAVRSGDRAGRPFVGPAGRLLDRALKESDLDRSDRLKSSPFRSAMSMLTFYLNRGGKNLSTARKRKLEAAKVKLREAFGRKPR